MVLREKDSKGNIIFVNEGGEQAQEFTLAQKEGRQPKCVYCGKPLNEVKENQRTFITWRWSPTLKGYIKDDNCGDSEKPYCGWCEVHDWEFVNNDFIFY
ncbi:MAG: hypothetical protein PHI12_08420 [Dehalococcoidales bacterium]|nr:hypothetical protein [Dehalococcoidales bacterium]